MIFIWALPSLRSGRALQPSLSAHRPRRLCSCGRLKGFHALTHCHIFSQFYFRQSHHSFDVGFPFIYKPFWFKRFCIATLRQNLLAFAGRSRKIQFCNAQIRYKKKSRICRRHSVFQTQNLLEAKKFLL